MTELVTRVHAAVGRTGLTSRGRPYVLGLYRSVVMVLFVLRHNPVRQVAAELFSCCQSTVSRRVALLRPLVERVLAEFVPDPGEASQGRVVLVDGTLVTTWAGRAKAPRCSPASTVTPASTCNPNNVRISIAFAQDSFAGDMSATAPGSVGLISTPGFLDSNDVFQVTVNCDSDAIAEGLCKPNS
ncbi:hypothetical protein [Streptomyces osmaniensis]|uniref:hypothetical protein n=1 Tax=Streptomyces osmaniensis TaxID=593134 RepID=UPI001C32D086|nr:hypothetical protein KJK32_45140 [Streptomyces sp. JCM17656]